MCIKWMMNRYRSNVENGVVNRHRIYIPIYITYMLYIIYITYGDIYDIYHIYHIYLHISAATCGRWEPCAIYWMLWELRYIFSQLAKTREYVADHVGHHVGRHVGRHVRRQWVRRDG